LTIEQWKSVAGLVESFAKMIALAVGGSWTYMLFIRKRQQYPRSWCRVRRRKECSSEDEDQRPTGRPKAGSVDPTSAPETRVEAIHARERAEARRISGSGETKIGQRERTMQIKLAPGPPKLPPKPPPPQGPRKRREV